MTSPYARPGYIFLISVLFIGAAVVATTISLLLLAWAAEQNGQTFAQATQAREFAQACTEYAMRQLHRDPSYAGLDTLVFSDGSCNVLPIQGSPGSNRMICTEGIAGPAKKRLQVAVDQLFPTMTISMYSELLSSVPCALAANLSSMSSASASAGSSASSSASSGAASSAPSASSSSASSAAGSLSSSPSSAFFSSAFSSSAPISSSASAGSSSAISSSASMASSSSASSSSTPLCHVPGSSCTLPSGCAGTTYPTQWSVNPSGILNSACNRCSTGPSPRNGTFTLSFNTATCAWESVQTIANGTNCSTGQKLWTLLFNGALARWELQSGSANVYPLADVSGFCSSPRTFSTPPSTGECTWAPSIVATPQATASCGP